MTKPVFNPKPVTLETENVLLRPMQETDLQQLYHLGNYQQIHQFRRAYDYTCMEASHAYYQLSLEQQKLGKELPFVTLDKRSQQIVGATRYLKFETQHKTLEIGATFITPKHQRSHINTHAKFLMLQHAFESLGAMRVQINTSEENQVSQNAILRLGAKFEGKLRQHMRLVDNSVRNTMVYSIIDSEWPQIKKNLLVKMERYHA